MNGDFAMSGMVADELQRLKLALTTIDADVNDPGFRRTVEALDALEAAMAEAWLPPTAHPQAAGMSQAQPVLPDHVCHCVLCEAARKHAQQGQCFH
jgi:hypothetical protein